MMSDISKWIDSLNNLIALNKDSAKGFRRASEEMTNVGAEQLSDMMREFERTHVRYVDDLQESIDRRGEEPQEEGSELGTLERGWLNIKAAMTIERDWTAEVILADRIEHQEKLLSSYRELLGEQPPDELAELLNEQRNTLSEMQERMEKTQVRVEETATS